MNSFTAHSNADTFLSHRHLSEPGRKICSFLLIFAFKSLPLFPSCKTPCSLQLCFNIQAQPPLSLLPPTNLVITSTVILSHPYIQGSLWLLLRSLSLLPNSHNLFERLQHHRDEPANHINYPLSNSKSVIHSHDQTFHSVVTRNRGENRTETIFEETVNG